MDEIIPILQQFEGTLLSVQFIEAMTRVEKRLEADALNEGESRSGNRRILFEWHLIVDFEVYQSSRVAAITQVRFRP